jgi:hypothetical protein
MSMILVYKQVVGFYLPDAGNDLPGKSVGA